MKIEATTSLNKEEIEKLKNEAAQHATEDTEKRELIEIKNQAESIVYFAKKSIKDAGEKITAELKDNLNKKIEEVKAVKDGNDKEVIKKVVDELSAHLQKIGEGMYNKKDDNQRTDDAQPSNN